MQRPPHLEFKTLGVVPLDVPPGLEYKNVGGDVLETVVGHPLSYKTAATGAVIDSHVEGDTGIVEAYVAVTGTRDEVGDVIEHYAFDRTLKSLRPKMCLGHDWNRPIGEPEEIEFLAPGHPGLPAETADGQPWPTEAGALYTKNRYMLGTQDGRDAYEHAKFFKHRTAYSIGYVVKKSRIGYHKGLKTRFIEDLDLYEYGPVLHGAHSLALQKSVKTGEPNDIESKVRKVKDSAYWGYAVGTPITANMKPRGTTARKLRAQGKVPPRDVGTTDSVTAAGKPAPKRAKVDGLAEAADANGLFPEPDDGGARVRAANPKGKDEEHVASLVDSETMFDDTPDGAKGADEQRHAAFGGLVDEGITPNELEEDLKATSWPDDVDETEKQERIDDLVGEYRSRYQREARRQSGGKPAEDAAPDGDAPDAPEVPAGDGSAETDDPESAPAPAGDTEPQTPVEAAPSARKPPKVKKGEKLHTVTGANGEKFYRGSKRDYSHAVLYTDEAGKQSAYSFHGSESGARSGVAELRRRGLTGKADITPVEGDADSSVPAPENPDKSTAAMWRRDPKRAETLLTPERRAELDAADARTRSLYADERGRGEKHESAMQRASRPLQDDESGHITDADRLWGTDPRAASMALSPEEKDDFNVLNGEQQIAYADSRMRGVRHPQAVANAKGNAPDKAPETPQVPDAPAGDVNAPEANAPETPAPDVSGAPAAGEPDVPAAPDAEAAPATPEAPEKPTIQALANSAAMDNDLSNVGTEDLKAVDAEMAKRAEMLGHPGEITKVHQRIKDMIAGREDGSLPEPNAAAPELLATPDTAAPEVPAVPDGNAPAAEAAQGMDLAQAKQFIDQNYGQWRNDLTPEQDKAIRFYQSPGYALMNGQLRGLDPEQLKTSEHATDSDLARASKAVTDLDAAIAAAPPLKEPLTAFRGFSADQFGELTPGKTIQDKAFVSLSLTDDAGAVGRAGEQATAEVRLPAGTQVAAGSARELILPTGSSFTVVSAGEKDGKKHYVLDYTPGGGAPENAVPGEAATSDAPPVSGTEGVNAPESAPAVATGDLSKTQSMSDEQLAAELAKAQADFDAVRDQPRTSNTYTEAKLSVDQLTTEQRRREQGGAVEPGDAPSETAPPLDGAPDDASSLAIPGADVTPGAEAVNSPAPPPLDRRTVITAATLGQPERIAPLLAASYPEAYADGTNTADGDAAALVAARAPALVLMDIEERNQRKQDAAAHREPSATDEAATTLDPATTAQLNADDIAEANATADASFGITEADDGAFEVDTDVSDRQERVSALLDANEEGRLDLTSRTDDGLRSTRADVVNELKLQDHLADRSDGTRSATRRQRGNSSSASESDGSDTGDTAPPGPKTRPGVAGAAEDLADALEGTDAEAIISARARLESSLRRSKSDSEVVHALRALIETGQQDIDPVLLRTAAEHLRIEARNRRNEQARNRRTAKRLDRDRLRSLLGSVDAEMRRRNLAFDPVPGLDAEDTGTSASVATGSTTAGTWQTSTVPWSGAAATQVNGTGYSGHVETLNGMTRYQWAATGPDGTELASGSGTMSDPETARTAVAHALAAQQTLGRIPSDSVLPPTPANDSPAQRQQAERSGTEAIRARIDDSSVNPITGKPNPLAPPSGLKTLGTPVFASPAAVRAHLDASTVDRAGNPNAAGDIRWDDVKLTPGGGMAVGTNLRGEPVLFHTGSGASIPPTISGKTLPMNKSDLLKMATIMEALPDADGNVIDFSDPDRRALGAAILNWRSADGDTNNMGLALVNVAARSIVAEKLRAGKWSDPVVKQVRMSATAGDGTNPTRRAHLDDLHRTLGQMANVRSGKVPTEDKKTLDIARAARELSDAGAPDAAAVVLRRRAAELRDLGAKADEAVATAKAEGLDRPNLSTRANDFKTSLRMADVLDDLAAGHLSMHSPAPSPGERAIRLQPGERIAFPEGDGVRTYRVLSPMRSLEGGAADSSYAQVVDETTGQQLTAAIIGGSNMSPNFQVYDPDVKVGIFHGTAHATPLGGNGFAVLDADEPAPAPDGFKAAGYANISAIPAEALDRAAGELPETKAETAARRAATPDGVRAPARRSTAAPRRSAPAARLAPDDREQALAQSQTTALNLWQKAPFETADAAPAGGFRDFSEVQAAALKRYQNWPPGADERYRSSLQSLTVDDAGSEGSGNYNLGTGGAKLSLGGHFIVRKDGSIVHAHTGLIAWQASSARKWGIDDVETPSPALAMRIADYLERGDIGGNSVNWVTNDPDAIIESAKTVTEQSGGINPMATITKAAYLDHAAVTPRMTASDITSVTSLTSSATPESYVPNTDLLTGLLIGDTENSYNALGGKRTSAMVLSKAEDIPAISGSKEGQTLAKRVAGEYALTRGQAKVAPLDAVRRLNALAAELDGRTIESTDGKTFTPSDDLRARAQAITDAFDETKPSPMGMLARNNFDATIAPDLSKADISVGQVFSGGWQGRGGAESGTRNVRTARLKTELREGGTIKMERGESGNLRATLGGRTVEDGVDGGKVSTNANGSIEVSWREDLYGGAAEPKVRLPAGTWKLDGGGPAASTGGGISDADYEAHTAQIEEKLGEALSNGEATDRTMTLGQDGQSWTPERAKLHNEIIDELWQTNGASVPTEGKAVIAGGLGGAGKSTVLKGYAGIDATQYFTINPDDVKEAMAARDMIPKVEGLSPMEASPLIHEESSHIANLLGARAYANSTNVVWDITMSREASVKRRAAEMRKAGYTDISGVYVDIPIETSVERALARHRQGLDQANAGNGNGGRYVPPALIRAMASDQASSINRETFDKLKTQFDSWVIYDNAVAGREPKKIAGIGQWGGESRTVPVAPKAPEPPAPGAI